MVPGVQLAAEVSKGQPGVEALRLPRCSCNYRLAKSAYACLQVDEFKDFLGSLGLWPIPVTGHVPDVDEAAAQRIHHLLKHLMTVCMEMSRLSNAMRQDVRCYLHATATE